MRADIEGGNHSFLRSAKLRGIFLLAIFALCIGCRPEIKILAYNVRHGEGLDGRVDLERTAAVIRRVDPDIVLLQEIDNRTGRTGGIDQAAELGRLTGLSHAFGRFMDYDGGEYGMALLSRFPIVGFENHVLPPGLEPRSALSATIELDEDNHLILVGIHLYRTAEERLAQANKLVELFSEESKPVILAGDFNSTPDSEVISLLKKHWTIADKGKQHLTFPADSSRIEIDYIMYRPQSNFKVLESRVIDEQLASDHRPVLLKLGLEKP